MTYSKQARRATRRIRIGWNRVASLLGVIAAIAMLGHRLPASSSSRHETAIDVAPSDGDASEAVPSTVWPPEGQAAFVQTGESQVHAGPNQHPAAIASVAKVMTAYLVLRDHPLQLGEEGPTITLTDADVVDIDRRRQQRESVVPITAGERLTERQALQALPLPSANNVAAVLARWDAGAVDWFVARMNATARSMGLTRTRYTDPSGYDDGTVSTAAETRCVSSIGRCACRCSRASSPHRPRRCRSPAPCTTPTRCSGGTVSSASRPGSTAAAGGCFVFRAIRSIGGKRTTIIGVVLGQPGHDQIAAGLAAAETMVDRITGHRAVPDGRPGTLPPRIGPCPACSG